MPDEPFTIGGRRLGVPAYFAALVVSVAVLIARRPQSVIHPNLWAEDGIVFFRAAMLEPWYESLGQQYNGYLHFGLRVWAELATLLPVAAVALVYGLFNILLFPLCLSVVLSRRMRWLIPSDAARAVLYVVLLLLPGVSETLGNLTNALWPIAIGMLLLSFCDEPVTRRGRVAEIVALVVGGMTGAASMLLVPGFALRWWRQRTRHNAAVAGAVIVTALVQAAILLANPRPGLALEPAPRTIPRAFVLRVWGALTLGEQTLVDHVLPYAAPLPVLILCAIAIALTAAALLGVPRVAALHVVAVFAVSAAATVWAYEFNLVGMAEGVGGGRYFLIPMVLVLVTVFAAACAPAWRRNVVRFGVLGPAAALLTFAIVADLGVPALPPTHWARTAKCIESERPCEVVVNPAGWTFHLPPVP